jgi:glutamine amidotransferase
MIVIVDYGMGNLRSVQKLLIRLEAESKISLEPRDLENADKIILPGVGHFAKAMANLAERGFIDPLRDKVLQQKTPILGICLGMQLFSRRSEEGNVDGLGWIDAETVRFALKEGSDLKIPHMGWNSVDVCKESPLVNGLGENPLFYFVHSYHVVCRDPSDILTTTDYGIRFISSVQKENIFGTQFHPEKSHMDGIKIMKNFLDFC